MIKRIVVLALLIVGAPSLAQDYDADQLAEIERRKQFQASFEAILENLNQQSFVGFTRSIEADDFLERILGLRLIDRRIQQSVSRDFETSVLPALVKDAFADFKDGEVSVSLLDFRSSGPDGRAVIRLDLPNFQFNYWVLQLRYQDARERVIIVDWIDYLYSQQFTESYGEGLVAATPTRAAVRKLITQRLSDSEIFQLTELLKAARDREADRFTQIWESMGERVKRERVVVRLHAQLMRQLRKRRNLRVALVEISKYFPDEPLFSLPLLDYYFPSRQYDKAIEALLRLERQLGVEDSAMKARLSAAKLAAGEVDEAEAYADEALAMQPGLELAWWSKLRVSVAASKTDDAINALTRLEDDFGHTLDGNAFSRDRAFRSFVATPEFKSWSEGRHSSGDD
ncbi:MAG: hypothetical protein AAF917_02365 [Pseudomonadota bacterium]